MPLQTSPPKPATLAFRDNHRVDAETRTRAALASDTKQILTINVEEYFQAGVFHRFVDAANWYRFDTRLQQNVEETLALLAEHQTTATFFVLGWLAEKYPQLIRRISDSGHEIASRGYLHQPILTLERRDRFEDLKRSRLILEDVTGQPVHGFRLSDGWLRRSDLPFLEDVREAGYLYDSSLMPKRRDFRSEPTHRLIHTHQLRAGRLIEIPPSTIPFAGSWLPIAGGNYQRQLPDALMRSAVNRWTQTEASPFVMYFQVWEMDSEQPRLSAFSRLTQIRHYRNLGKYRWLLPQYLRSWDFCSVRDHAALDNSPLKQLETSPRPAAKRASPTTYDLAEEKSQSATRPREENPAGDARVDSKVHHRRRTAVTLVVPCFNEEGSLPYLARTLEHLKNVLSDYELKVLFVDDCSTDNSYEVLQHLFADESDVRIIRHEQNSGVSAAILTGIEAADTDIVCSIDCDCSYDPLQLQYMLPLMKPGVAMVTASPYHRKGRVKNVPGWRLMLSRSLSLIYRILLRQSLATWTSCFRVYRRCMIMDLPLEEKGFLGTAELAAQLCLHQRPIVEHPTVLEVRLFGVSKMKTLNTIGNHLKLLERITCQRLTGVR